MECLGSEKMTSPGHRLCPVGVAAGLATWPSRSKLQVSVLKWNADLDLTDILNSASAGDGTARAELIEIAYQDLKRLATAKMTDQRLDHTLTATALVNEVTLKMLKESSLNATSGKQFFAFASTAMRNLLIDHARSKGRQKRGGDLARFTFDEAVIACETQSEELLALNDALKSLEEIEPRKAQVVEMRYFGGLSNQEVADGLNVSLATVKRDWIVAKSWLMCALRGEETPD